MVEVRVTARATWSACLRESLSIIVTVYFTSGRKIFQSVTQTPASARMSAWFKSGGNKSHISVGRYIWIQFQDEEVPLSITYTYWTQRTRLHLFPVSYSISQAGINMRGTRARTWIDASGLGRLIALLPAFLR